MVQERIRTQTLELVDEDGKPQAVLKAGKLGPTFDLFCTGDAGSVTIDLEGQRPRLLMAGDDGEDQVVLAATPDGPVATLQGPEGSLSLRVSPEGHEGGGPRLELCGPDGSVRARTAVDGGDVALDLHDPRERNDPLVTLSARDGGSALRLFRIDMNGPAPGVWAHTTPQHGGRLEILDRDLDVIAEIPEGHASATDRLRDRLVAAVADMAEVEGLAADELEALYADASEAAQGPVGRLARGQS